MDFKNVTASPKSVLDIKMTNKRNTNSLKLPVCGLHSTFSTVKSINLTISGELKFLP